MPGQEGDGMTLEVRKELHKTGRGNEGNKNF